MPKRARTDRASESLVRVEVLGIDELCIVYCAPHRQVDQQAAGVIPKPK